jgi:hypothetical protein
LEAEQFVELCVQPKLIEPGEVAPKVMHYLIEEGQFSDDEVQAGYFGGVLA